jgi:hypothetical protein
VIATQKETDLSHEASADTPTGKAALTGVHESADRGPVQRRSAKTFIFHNSIRDLSEFRGYAEIASRLTPYGTVELDIGVLAEKSPTHMPGFRSPWHDYGAYMATMWAFFPHPALAPHLSSDWVAKNRALLLGKVAILEEMGLEAVFSANESQFLPESFFREYPHLRGPRVDAKLQQPCVRLVCGSTSDPRNDRVDDGGVEAACPPHPGDSLVEQRFRLGTVLAAFVVPRSKRSRTLSHHRSGRSRSGGCMCLSLIFAQTLEFWRIRSTYWLVSVRRCGRRCTFAIHPHNTAVYFRDRGRQALTAAGKLRPG